MRKRVSAFEAVIKKARREPEGAKTWKENFVQSHEDRELKEEKKKEEAFMYS